MENKNHHEKPDAQYLSVPFQYLSSPESLPRREREFRIATLRKLYIEPTTLCNFACPMCARNFWDDKHFQHMDWDVFTAAVDSAATLGTVETVFFGGFGEPLFAPRIVDMVRYARNAGFRTELITNGKLMDEPMILALLDAGIQSIWVSFEGEDPNTSGHSAFGADEVRENLRSLYRLRYTHRPEELCELNLSCVIMRSNVHLLPQIVDTAHQLSAQNVLFTHIVPYDESSLDEICYRRVVQAFGGVKGDGPRSTRIRLPFSDFGDAGMLEFLDGCLLDENPLLLGLSSVSRQHQYCPFVNDGDTFVRADGSVCPCMALLHSGPVYFFEEQRHIKDHTFGKVTERPLADIWNGEEYTDFRRRVMEFAFSPCYDCGGCELRLENQEDCIGNAAPTCGACLWATGVIQCP